MGAFKPLLPWGRQTVIESCVNYLRTGGAETIIVVLGHRAEEVRTRLRDLPLTFALNPDSNTEMNASIAAGLKALPATARAVLIALADYPAVPPSVVSSLLAEWQTGSQLLIPTWQNRGGHPVLIDLDFRAELEQLDPTRGLKALFQSHLDQVKRLPVDSPYIARDLDTWDDYTTLYKEVFGEPAPDRAE
jgi:molybdenum cofactor cytidylyltransferase